MRRRKIPPKVVVQIVTPFTAECRGPGVHQVLERLQIPMQFQYNPPSRRGKCWTVPARHARDVAAMAELLGGDCEIDGQVSLWS